MTTTAALAITATKWVTATKADMAKKTTNAATAATANATTIKAITAATAVTAKATATKAATLMAPWAQEAVLTAKSMAQVADHLATAATLAVAVMTETPILTKTTVTNAAKAATKAKADHLMVQKWALAGATALTVITTTAIGKEITTLAVVTNKSKAVIAPTIHKEAISAHVMPNVVTARKATATKVVPLTAARVMVITVEPIMATRATTKATSLMVAALGTEAVLATKTVATAKADTAKAEAAKVLPHPETWVHAAVMAAAKANAAKPMSIGEMTTSLTATTAVAVHPEKTTINLLYF